MCGPIEYHIEITPSLRSLSLITVDTVVQSINFANSQNTADIDSYSVTFQAGFQGFNTVIESKTATYQYTDPCLSTSITGMSAAVDLVQFEGFSVSTAESNYFTDSVSASIISITPNMCGDVTVSYQINS